LVSETCAEFVAAMFLQIGTQLMVAKVFCQCN